MEDFTTPMMKQYMAIKRSYSDCLLFFRLGDFYELFMEDATIGSQVLGITLTGRPRGKDGRIPMAGVPYHAVDGYLSKLVKAGYKVAICEQVSEPNSKGIVQREVVRVVSPGTILDEKALEQKENNYICAIQMDAMYISFVYCDITTGVFFAKQFGVDNIETQLADELTTIGAAECVLPPDLYNDPHFLGLLKKHSTASIFVIQRWNEYRRNAEKILKKHFHVSTLAGFNIHKNPVVIEASAALLSYLKETQKSDLVHIQKITLKEPEDYVHLDRATIVNLELFSTIRDRETNGSLLTSIDQTQTAMGGRMMKTWLVQPLTDKKKIENRLDAVEELLKNSSLTEKIYEALSHINDIERIFSRISVGIGNARDLVALSQNIKSVLAVKHLLLDTKSSLLQKSQRNIQTKLWRLVQMIENTIVDEPPIHLKEGGLIKDGVDANLDRIREIVRGGKDWITELEAIERKRTGIQSLKLRFNKVFGFYIEVTKSNLHLIPGNYIRKQTIVNGERFITPELKEKEEQILRSEEEMKTVEYEIYKKLYDVMPTYTEVVQKAALSLATIDCITSFTVLAKKWRYTRPTILYSGELRIKNGRHPVVEQMVGRTNFIPNDVELGTPHPSLMIITGPNMAGKSVYLRQTAVITLLALIGSYVPAQSAHVSTVDALFVRSGASDVIAAGLSTFMVEMVETAYILNHATEKSLIIMDEIGRGTSTYDGVSIAYATAEYISTHFKKTPKTVFATHYLELTMLEAQFPGKIINMHMQVDEKDGVPVFLHAVKKGPASKSFGVAVASLAGVPSDVVKRATSLLYTLEEGGSLNPKSLNQRAKVPSEIATVLSNVDINTTSPLDAFSILSRLIQLVENDKH